MGIGPKMPAVGPGLVSVLAQYAVKSPAGIIRSQIIHQPVLPIGDTAEVVVAIEKYMWNLLGLQFQVKLPDIMVGFLCAGGPVNVDHKILVALLI